MPNVLYIRLAFFIIRYQLSVIYLLFRDKHLNPSIFCFAFGCTVIGNRFGIARPYCGNSNGVNAVEGQISLDGSSAHEREA